MAKGRLTTSVEEDLIKKLKLYAVQNDTSVTAIMEDLIINFMSDVDKKDK